MATIVWCIFRNTIQKMLHFIQRLCSSIITEYARAACGLKYKMDYTRIKEMNITMCNQLYFAPNYLKYSDLTKLT
jgi:hypothetical protein